MVLPCVRDDKPPAVSEWLSFVRAVSEWYRLYTRTNHIISCLLHFSTMHPVHLQVSDVEHLSIYLTDLNRLKLADEVPAMRDLND